MRRIQALVFDLDDTLFPERDFVLGGFRAAARWAAGRYGASEEASYEALRGWFEGGVRGDTFDRWRLAFDLPTEAVAGAVEAYRAHTPSITLFEDARDLLPALRGRGYRLGIVTDGYATVQRRKLRALGIEDLVDAVVVTDELGRDFWKPHPRAFHAVCDAMGVLPDTSVYIADNCSKDFIGARKAGLATIWARHGGGDHACRQPTDASFAADHELTSLRLLPELLDRHFLPPTKS